jgi:hypothetical protein
VPGAKSTYIIGEEGGIPGAVDHGLDRIAQALPGCHCHTIFRACQISRDDIQPMSIRDYPYGLHHPSSSGEAILLARHGYHRTATSDQVAHHLPTDEARSPRHQNRWALVSSGHLAIAFARRAGGLGMGAR